MQLENRADLSVSKDLEDAEMEALISAAATMSGQPDQHHFIFAPANGV
jgi:hypothetical protein